MVCMVLCSALRLGCPVLFSLGGFGGLVLFLGGLEACRPGLGLDCSGCEMGGTGGMERWSNTLDARRGRRISRNTERDRGMASPRATPHFQLHGRPTTLALKSLSLKVYILSSRLTFRHHVLTLTIQPSGFTCQQAKFEQCIVGMFQFTTLGAHTHTHPLARYEMNCTSHHTHTCTHTH